MWEGLFNTPGAVLRAEQAARAAQTGDAEHAAAAEIIEQIGLFLGRQVLGLASVVGGHLRVDTPVDLPDNTEVDLIEADGAEADDDPELRAALRESVGQVERGEVIAAEDVLDELCASGTDEWRVSG